MICICNDGADDLVVGKVYQLFVGENGGDGFVRITDESGEDYLYPSDMFVPIDSRTTVQF